MIQRAMSNQLVDTQENVDRACGHLAGESAIGVDTEFLRVRTYYPKLALVQVSAGHAIYCFDPLARGVRLDPLWEVLAEPGILKVMHSARQDVEVLLHTAGVMPDPLFDTQTAAGLLGYGEQTGYAGLVEAEFGEVLPKGAQRTDWTRRPLSASQLGYAENDVRYLLPLYETLQRRLEGLGRMEWAREDFRRVLDPELYNPDPGVAYRRVGRGAHLERRAQYTLRSLCAWRERTARDRNLPRNWVMDDEAITSIAAAGPRSIDELERVEGVGGDVVRRDGHAIVECIDVTPGEERLLWPRHRPLTEGEKAVKKSLLRVLKERAASMGIPESVLITRSDIDRLARGESVAATLQGWRLRELGEAFERVLRDAQRKAGGQS
jgi:ribonuclease D